MPLPSLLQFSHRDIQSMVELSIGLLYVIDTMNDSLDEPNDAQAIWKQSNQKAYKEKSTSLLRPMTVDAHTS